MFFILLIFGCVLLHEFGHAFAARMYGIPAPDVTLLPIGGLACLQRMPDEPVQELVVALAGPTVNVVIAVALLVFVGGPAGVEELGELDHARGELLARVAVVNVILAVFNMIPAFPMDGGRVLRALLATVMSYGRATAIAARVGQGIAFLFGFVGLFWNPLLIFIALFVYLRAAQEAAAAQVPGTFRATCPSPSRWSPASRCSRKRRRSSEPWTFSSAPRGTSSRWWTRRTAFAECSPARG